MSVAQATKPEGRGGNTKGGPRREHRLLDAATDVQAAPAQAGKQAAGGMGVETELDVAADVAGVKEDMTPVGHVGDEQAAAELGRDVGHHVILAAGDAGTVAAVVAPGRLHDLQGREIAGDQDTEGALVAGSIAPQNGEPHGAGAATE